MGADDDRWLERWLPALRAAAAGNAVLELGCDTGGDTAWLLAQGLHVVATDISLPALRTCAQAAPGAWRVQHDLRTPLPFADASFGAVVASLCLHYFDWRTTEAAVAQVHRCLRPGGLLLCRVNSVHDVLHGAGQGVEIEPGFYQLDAHYADHKRFFSAADLGRLFGDGWTEVARQECTVHRYAAPKVAWEIVLRRHEAPATIGPELHTQR